MVTTSIDYKTGLLLFWNYYCLPKGNCQRTKFRKGKGSGPANFFNEVKVHILLTAAAGEQQPIKAVYTTKVSGKDKYWNYSNGKKITEEKPYEPRKFEELVAEKDSGTWRNSKNSVIILQWNQKSEYIKLRIWKYLLLQF